MRITSRNEGEVTVLDVEGRLVIGEGDVELRQAVAGAIESGSRRLLINLAGVKSMDSSGLGELVRSKATAARAGVTIKLLHVESRVREILEMTQLIGVFEAFEDETDAITSFD